eukprot:TRINITY_DN5713_c0_g1_i1.p1 TRINITY_DN5713_c0_g1~~TRINITY_DN5713_c0_g1_i1.p1  ORF type:complete len:381 (+),score=50.80 TRINITY_DN5713_c0_g1_i1:115-1257(+)
MDAKAESLRTIKVFLLGFGSVGHSLLQQLQNLRQFHQSNYGVEFEISLLADSSAAIPASEPSYVFSSDLLSELTSWKREQRRNLIEHEVARTYQGVSPSDVILSHLRACGPRHCVLVDCSATSLVSDVLVQALECGACVVLANKKPLTGPQEIFDKMNSHVHTHRLRYECTVGSATPMIAALRRIVSCGDQDIEIEATLSGTLGYISTGLQHGNSFSSLVRQAHAMGYTEPDPRDDLRGTDVARKALILARTIGYKFELAQVEVEPLMKPELENLSVPDFLQSVSVMDEEIATRVQAAKQQQQVLRYVAQISARALRVGLREVPAISPLGSLQGSSNLMQLTSRTYSGGQPVVVQGRGAGPAITASGVISDMIDLVLYNC